MRIEIINVRNVFVFSFIKCALIFFLASLMYS